MHFPKSHHVIRSVNYSNKILQIWSHSVYNTITRKQIAPSVHFAKKKLPVSLFTLRSILIEAAHLMFANYLQKYFLSNIVVQNVKYVLYSVGEWLTPKLITAILTFTARQSCLSGFSSHLFILFSFFLFHYLFLIRINVNN